MQKKLPALLVILCLLTGALLLINRDIFRYEKISVYRRGFDPVTDGKGDYILSPEQTALKPGSYKITVEGDFRGSGSGFFLIDPNSEKLLAVDLPSGQEIVESGFDISGSTRQLRFGVSYDPGSAELTVDRITLQSDHVLYKESLMKHAAESAAAILIAFLLILRFVFPAAYRRMFPNLSEPENERMIVFILFLTLLTAAPFYRSDTYVDGDDLYFHLRHLRGIAASLKAGHFPVRVLLDWLENYGYGSGFYYPNIFLTIPGILILLGFHAIAAYEIFVTVCTFFMLLTMFLTLRRIAKSEAAAYCSVIIYAFAAYRLADIYYRAAIGEIQAFIFLPLIILGLFEIFNGHPERWWIFGLAFTGLLWCHMISLALAGIITAVWALLHIRRIFSDRKIFFALLKAVVMTLCLGAWFLLPMAEQSATNELKINMIMFSADAKPYGSYSDWDSLFLYFYDWNYVVARRSVYPGWPLLLIPLLRLFLLRRKDDRLMKLADQLTIYGFVTMIMCTNLFPWKYFLQLLYRIQFAWRIMMLSTVLLSVSCGIYAARLLRKFLSDRPPALQLTPLFLLCAACGVPILVESLTNRAVDMDYYRYVERSNFLSGSEYLPVNLKRETIEKTGDHVVCEVPGFEMLSAVRKGLSFTYSYHLPEDVIDAEMRVPLIYYTGYRGYLTGPGNETREIPISKDSQGLITVLSGDVPEGSITVRYVKTAAQHAGDCVSLAAALFFIFRGLKRKKETAA